MRYLALGVLLLGMLICVLPGAEAQTPGGNGKDLDASLLGPGVFTGKLISTPDSDRMFVVAVTYQAIEPNPNFRPNPNIQREIANIQRMEGQLQATLRARRNPGNLVGQIQRAAASSSSGS